MKNFKAGRPGRAFGTFLAREKKNRIAVGRDLRTSSPPIFKALVEGLLSAGCEVTELGLVPTPLLYFSVSHLKLDAGISITGSHNPPQYNGLKLHLSDRPFYGREIQELENALSKHAAANAVLVGEPGVGTMTTVLGFAARVGEGRQALFNQDNGTGRGVNLSSAGLVNASANLARWLSNVPADLTRNITFAFPGSPAGGGSDNASFICSGAPAFGLGSEQFDYFNYTWHTNRDTYDKLDWDDLRNNATLTAMLVYLASEDPQRVPRDRRTVFSPGQGGRPGAWPTCGQVLRATPTPPTR